MRRGIGMVEVLVGIFIIAALGLPILANVSTAVRETAAGEEYMFAEALALEHLEQALSRPLDELEHELPELKELPDHDDVDRKRTQGLKSFQAHLAGSEAFRGTVQIDALAPRLLRYVVTVEWPISPGSHDMRRLVLVRLRCPSDLGLKFREITNDTPHERALEVVRE